MSQALTLSFQSDTTQARNAIAQLASTVVTNMLTIGSAMKTAADNAGKLQSGIAAIPGVLRGAAAGFIAFEAIKLSMEAVAKAAEQAREKLAEIVKVANEAQSTGVGSNFLQQWKAQADALNESTEKLVAMLQRARDVSTVNLGTGGNANASLMQNLLGQHIAAGNIGQGDADAFNAAGSQEDRIRAILDLIDKLTAAGKQLAALNIGQTMFGKDFENQLRNGVNIVQQMRDALASTKDVAFPPDVIARGVEINKQLEDAERKMREGWLPVQQDILRWQQDELASLAQIKGIIADIAVSLGSWYVAIKNAGNAASDLVNSLAPVKALAEWTKSLPEGIFGRMSGVEFLDDAARQRLIDARTPPPARDLTVPVGDRSRPLPARATSAGSQTDEVDTYIKSLQKSVEVLEAENRTYGQSNTLKAEAVDLEKALAAARVRGTPLTDAERESVKRLADQEGAAKDKAEQLTKATEGANARAAFLGDQGVSAIERIGQAGVRAKDIVLDFAKALEKAALQAAFLGTGPLAQLFGTGGSGGNAGGLAGALLGGSGLFRNFGFGGGYGASEYASAAAAAAPGAYGPGFADGGIMTSRGPLPLNRYAAGGIANSPQLAMFGEGRFPEAYVPLPDGRSIPVNMKGGGGSGPMNINVTHAPVFNGTGLSKEEVVAVGLQLQKGFARQIGPILSDWQRRHG